MKPKKKSKAKAKPAPAIAPPPPAPLAPPPILGEWWLTRSNQKATCNVCSGPIKPHECRMIYVPSASAEKLLAGKPDVYKKMFEKTQRLYHHVAEECLPPHELGGV
jgi:hypothetical protein